MKVYIVTVDCVTKDYKKEFFKVHGNTKIKNILKVTRPDLDKRAMASSWDFEKRIGEIPALRKVIYVYVTDAVAIISTIAENVCAVGGCS